MRIHTRKYRNIDCIVIAVLICAILAIQSPAQPKPKPPDQWLLPVCIGVVMLVVGGCVVIKVANFCDSRFPRTNSIPRTNRTQIVLQGSSDLTSWSTVMETNCYMDEFEYQPKSDLQYKFYRVMFP